MGKPERILIIDDEEPIRMLLKEWLHTCGYECGEAADGSEGLNRALDEDWDLVLSDIVMPGLNGIELARVMKQFKSAVPVVMISAERSSGTIQSAFREGAYDFILKPFDMDELEMTIARALERSRLAKENEDYRLLLEKRVEEQAEKIRSLTIGSIISLANALEAKDSYTNGHSQRVGEYSFLVAQHLDMDHHFREQIRVIGQLHDIGKIGLRESILNKPDRLTEEEYDLMKRHPVVSADILKPVIKDVCVICGVRHHHERFDGKGYPEQLKGDLIPLEARILTVADTYDAITTNRAYRASRGYDVAAAEIKSCSGSQFDPDVADAFLRVPQEQIEKVLLVIPAISQWRFDN